MYETIAQELAGVGVAVKYLGTRERCRFCGATDRSAFGHRRNAHTFPEALGNRSLFSLDECKACNELFSVYEDALCKAIGPYLTLGGILGKKGVRQTGRSAGASLIRHSVEEGRRRLEVKARGDLEGVASIDPRMGELHLRMPIEGDLFVPLYAYKALMRIALSLIPDSELGNFAQAIACLQSKRNPPPAGSMQVGFSFSHVGNAPPTLAGTLRRRAQSDYFTPYMISIFVACNVCFQIWLRSDSQDDNLPDVAALRLRWTSNLAKPEGGYYPVEYSEPLQFDWSGAEQERQPFEAFTLRFDPNTTKGSLTPVPRTTGKV